MGESASFEVHLGDADKVARQILPTAAGLIRSSADPLLVHEGMGNSTECPETTNAQVVYVGFTDYVAWHLRKGAEVTDGMAEALRDIVDLYRRADGQD